MSKDGQRDKGQPTLASTWLCQELKYREFSGSSGSRSFIYLFIYCCVLTILFLFCCTEGSRARCDAWLITWKMTLWVKHSVLQHTNSCTDAQIHNVWTFWSFLRPPQAVDFENDWKLVTLFIGGNDLCQYCNDRVSCCMESSQEIRGRPVRWRTFLFLFHRSTVVKHPRSVVWCPVYRAVSWYHSPNGPAHWSGIIKLCEQPSP